MKLLTANDLSTGRVIYWGDGGQPVASIQQALLIDPDQADSLLAEAQAKPAVFVNPYLIDVIERRPSGRDRLKETIRSAGPTVGHSLNDKRRAEVA